MVAAGKAVCNLTVGDFNSKYFPIPAVLLEEIHKAFIAGETNYPPSDGVLDLRHAVADFTAREYGVRYPLESTLIASGSRPLLYAAYRCVVNPGDVVVYPAPSWNNNHYVTLTRAKGIDLPTRRRGRLPAHARAARAAPGHRAADRAQHAAQPLGHGHEGRAPPRHRARRSSTRTRSVRRPEAAISSCLFDQVYGSLVFGAIKHEHPAALVPEIAPWLITRGRHLEGARGDGPASGLAAGGARGHVAHARPHRPRRRVGTAARAGGHGEVPAQRCRPLGRSARR